MLGSLPYLVGVLLMCFYFLLLIFFPPKITSLDRKGNVARLRLCPVGIFGLSLQTEYQVNCKARTTF